MNTINLDLANIKASEWFGKVNTNAVSDTEREYIDKLLTKIALNNVEDSVTFSDSRLVFIASKMLISYGDKEMLLNEYGVDEFFIYLSFLKSFYDENNEVRDQLVKFVTIWISYLVSEKPVTKEEAEKMNAASIELFSLLSFEQSEAKAIVPKFVIGALVQASQIEANEVVEPIENADIKDAGLEDREPEVKGESTEGGEVESQIKELQDSIETFQFLIEAGASEEETKELQESIETFQFLIETLRGGEKEDSTKKEEVEEEKDLRDQLEELGLTNMEKQVMEALINSLDQEPSYTNVDAMELFDVTNISLKKIRGVLASLVKKGIIYIDKSGSELELINLNKDYWYLHPEWKNEVDNYPQLPGKYAKGGSLDKKATYVPKRDIAEVEVEKNGKTKYVDGADLLDGVYVKKGKYAMGGRSRTGNYTITDDVGDAVVENADEEAVILFANTMFYYDAMDSGEEEIATLDEAISALKTMDYSVNTNKKK